jgi:hypothetical protein
MEGAILSGVLAATTIAEYFAELGFDGVALIGPRQLTARPANTKAEDFAYATPVRTLYSIHKGRIPQAVQEELDQKVSSSILA